MSINFIQASNTTIYDAQHSSAYADEGIWSETVPSTSLQIIVLSYILINQWVALDNRNYSILAKKNHKVKI